MRASGRLPPVWLLGLCNVPFGAYFAVMLLTIPQLLAAGSVPEPAIAAVTAIGLIPSFCSFFASPILDWRFTRRAYATVLMLLTVAMLVGALQSVHELTRLTVFLLVGSGTVNLYLAAIGGWFGSIVRPEQAGTLGAWITVGNVAGGGITAAVGITVLRTLPYALGVCVIAGILLAPLLLFPIIPTPEPDRRLARESFRGFFRDVMSLLRNRLVVWTLLLFALPASSFALTNTLSGLGRDFAASEQWVGLVTGAGVTVAGLVGSLVVPRLVRTVSPHLLYVCVGSAGALFTLSVMLFSKTPLTFALAVLGENVFQAAAFAVEATLVLATIGRGNALAATQYGLMIAAPNLPIAYMQAIDGGAYGAGGLAGTLVADGVISLTACAVAAFVLRKVYVRPGVPTPTSESVLVPQR
jgi:PAT family beta-lactamase induction signal transducer AmpG